MKIVILAGGLVTHLAEEKLNQNQWSRSAIILSLSLDLYRHDEGKFNYDNKYL